MILRSPRTYVHAELKYVYRASRVHHAQTKFKFKASSRANGAECIGAFRGPVLAVIRVLWLVQVRIE